MRYWIIRHKVTHAYLPQPQRGGATKYDLEPANRRRYPPRLFCTSGDARKAMAWWYSGPWYNGDGYPDNSPSSPESLRRKDMARCNELEVKEVWMDMRGRK